MIVEASVPPQGGVIVVGPGIHKIPGLVVMQQVWIVGAAVEAKLHHGHSRQPEPFSEVFHIVADNAEVFGHQRQIRKPLEAGLQKMVGGPGNPVAVPRFRSLGRYLPIRLQAPEMIDPDQLEQMALAFQSFQPPLVAISRHRVPVIQRVAPVLAVGGKIVRRNTGNDSWIPPGIEFEQMPVRPDIGAVVGNKNRNVTEQQNAFSPGVVPQALPLVIEDELLEPDSGQAGLILVHECL